MALPAAIEKSVRALSRHDGIEHNAEVAARGILHADGDVDTAGGKAVLLVSLELDEVMSLSDRILVMYEGEIVGELDPAKTTVQELGLYMAGAKRQHNTQEGKGEGSDE